jgi:hypothetical protein
VCQGVRDWLPAHEIVPMPQPASEAACGRSDIAVGGFGEVRRPASRPDHSGWQDSVFVMVWQPADSLPRPHCWFLIDTKNGHTFWPDAKRCARLLRCTTACLTHRIISDFGASTHTMLAFARKCRRKVGATSRVRHHLPQSLVVVGQSVSNLFGGWFDISWLPEDQVGGDQGERDRYD